MPPKKLPSPSSPLPSAKPRTNVFNSSRRFINRINDLEGALASALFVLSVERPDLRTILNARLD